MIAIVDYGAGNLASVLKAITHLGASCEVTSDAGLVNHADKLIVPGVGHFEATGSLVSSPLGDAVRSAMANRRPTLGICLGLQWLFQGSDEAPEMKGAGVFPGICRRFSERVKSPHVGWNQISVHKASLLLRGIPTNTYVYFTHSYRAPVCPDTVASCTYETAFTAAVERENLFGLQFHPEKSGGVGLQILENFCAL